MATHRETTIKTLILTEGGQNIGFGHVTRMLAIYQAFEEKGIKPKILVKGDSSVGSVLSGVDWESFDWIEKPMEIKQRFGKLDILLIDSYLAPKEVYEYLSKIANVPAYYDDFGRIEYPCGVVINGWLQARDINYPSNPCIRYCLGPKFLPLRKEFWDVENKQIRNHIENILITFGGADPKDMTPKVLNTLVLHFPKLTKKVVIGRGFQKDTVEKCERVADTRTEIIYFPDGEHMKKLMLEADIAISAGGQTLYELARVGVPTIAVIVADNQEVQVREFFRRGLIYKFFYWNELTDTDIVNSIRGLQNPSIRTEISTNARSFVKGQGAREIVKCLYELWKVSC